MRKGIVIFTAFIILLLLAFIGDHTVILNTSKIVPVSPSLTPTISVIASPTDAPTPTIFIPTDTPRPTIYVPTLAPQIQQGSGGTWTCDCGKTCTQISSCAEAQYLLNTCGCSARDGDHDGIACDGAPLHCQN